MDQFILPSKRNHRIKTTVSQLQTTNKYEQYDLLAGNKAAKSKIIRALSTGKNKTQKKQIADSMRSTSMARKKQVLFRFSPSPTQKYIFHIMDRGNNEDLISQLLLQRGNWTRNQSRFLGDAHFIWGLVGSSLRNKSNGKYIFSRVKGSQAITQKGNLYDNLSRYCQFKKIELNFIPITFHLKREGPPHQLRQNIKEFIQFFNYINDHTNLVNTWIVKPTNMNQGRDIHLFDSAQTLANLIKCKKLLFADSPQQPFNLQNAIQAYVRANRSLIIQKYIQNPYLINAHKFDIRIWVMLDHQRNYYVFEQGYLRFSSQPYKLNSNTIKDNFMHLTNHSLQKYSPNYSQTHNIQSITNLKGSLQSKGKIHHFDQILDQINWIIGITMKAGFVNEKQTSQKSFQLFGYDFMIDRELNVRLIEVNCNPAITLDCPLLQQLIPKMLNDMMKLTIDKLFRTKVTKNYSINRLKSINSWTLLGNLHQHQ